MIITTPNQARSKHSMKQNFAERINCEGGKIAEYLVCLTVGSGQMSIAAGCEISLDCWTEMKTTADTGTWLISNDPT